jgi:hypothetical protein
MAQAGGGAGVYFRGQCTDNECGGDQERRRADPPILPRVVAVRYVRFLVQ